MNHHHAHIDNSKARGFTLIELLIVFVITLVLLIGGLFIKERFGSRSDRVSDTQSNTTGGRAFARPATTGGSV